MNNDRIELPGWRCPEDHDASGDEPAAAGQGESQ
jgi:hypothetical protein